MDDSVTARQLRRGAGRPALIVTLALMLAGCASADAPLPFITTPDPETTATTTPAEPAAKETPATPQAGAAQSAPAAHAATPPQAATHAATPAQPAANASTATPANQPHSPTRQDLPFPSFAAPAAPGQRPVMTDAEKAKMQSDLEALAKSRETKMRQDIEQAQ